MRRFWWLFVTVLAALTVVYVIGSGTVPGRSIGLALTHATRQTAPRDAANQVDDALRALESYEQRIRSMALVFQNANTEGLRRVYADLTYFRQQYDQLAGGSPEARGYMTAFRQINQEVKAYETPSLSVFSERWALILKIALGLFLVLAFGTTAVRVFAGAA